MYKKIHRGDFRCPPWFLSDARRVITKLLDPNPSTRITIAKLVETPWFKKSPISKPVAVSLMVAEDEKGKEEEEPKRLNAFHLISLFEGFDLSPLFKQGGGRREEGLRFTTIEPASGVISRLERVAARAAERYRVIEVGTGPCRPWHGTARPRPTWTMPGTARPSKSCRAEFKNFFPLARHGSGPVQSVAQNEPRAVPGLNFFYRAVPGTAQCPPLPGDESGPTGVQLKGEELRRKGRLVVVAEIFAVAPSVLVVVIWKDVGDTLEYRSFCVNELLPALQDIV